MKYFKTFQQSQSLTEYKDGRSSLEVAHTREVRGASVIAAFHIFFITFTVQVFGDGWRCLLVLLCSGLKPEACSGLLLHWSPCKHQVCWLIWSVDKFLLLLMLWAFFWESDKECPQKMRGQGHSLVEHPCEFQRSWTSCHQTAVCPPCCSVDVFIIHSLTKYSSFLFKGARSQSWQVFFYCHFDCELQKQPKRNDASKMK